MSGTRRFSSLFWIAFVGLLALIGWNGAAGSAATSQQTPASQPVAAPDKSPERALLDRYCVSCHNEKLKTGGLALDTADLTKPGEHSEIWERVVYKIQGGMMPPVGRPRPDAAGFAALVEYLKTGLDSYASVHPNPGRTEPSIV